jgi:hypothetical protein
MARRAEDHLMSRDAYRRPTLREALPDEMVPEERGQDRQRTVLLTAVVLLFVAVVVLAFAFRSERHTASYWKARSETQERRAACYRAERDWRETQRLMYPGRDTRGIVWHWSVC